MSKSQRLTTVQADIGDYLKLCACTAVMLQTILGLALTTDPSTNMQVGIGVFYNLVKFTAPAFIFGILYTTTRTTIDHTELTYGQYMKNSWHGLFIPAILWTLVYLLLMPWVQQVNKFHDFPSFLWHFINGNAAPHLWYNTMMLQFIILMPLFWFIGRWVAKHPRRGWLVAGLAVIFQAIWLLFYDTQIFQGPHAADWYLFDRFFVSFLIFGVLGTLAWQFRDFYNKYIQKYWFVLVILFIGCFAWVNLELFDFGTPVLLANAPYYKPSMTLLDLVMIGLISALALYQIQHRLAFTNFVHRFANFAYKAYLSNVFWSQLLWLSFGKVLMNYSTLLGIIVLYLLTWCLSFASAFSLHAFWSRITRK